MNNNMNNQVVPNGQPNMNPNIQQPVQPQPMIQPNVIPNPNIQEQPMIQPQMMNTQPVQMVQPQMVPQQPIQPQPMIQPNVIPNPNIQEQPMIQPQMMNAQPVQMVQPQMMPQQPVQPQTTLGPQFATPVAPINNEETKEVTLEQEVVPSQDIQTSVVEENLSPANTEQFIDEVNSDSVTIDYNQLYGTNNEIKEEVVVEEENDRHIFTEQEIVIETPSIIERKNIDVTPEFNINALDTNIQDTENKLTDNILSEKQQDRADTRRKIIYLVVLFLLIAICIVWVFPIIAGAN